MLVVVTLSAITQHGHALVSVIVLFGRHFVEKCGKKQILRIRERYYAEKFIVILYVKNEIKIGFIFGLIIPIGVMSIIPTYTGHVAKARTCGA